MTKLLRSNSRYSNKYFLGWSINDMFRVRKIINKNFASIKPDIFLIGGYRFRINKIFDLEPSFLLSKVDSYHIKFDINTKVYYRSFNWISLTYKLYSSFQMTMGIRISKFLHIGYAYEFYTSKILKHVNGSHTFIIGRNFGLRAVEGIRKINK